MNFEHSEKAKDYIARLESFMDKYIYPVEEEVMVWNANPDNLWKPWPGIENLKSKAKNEGLWNLFLPKIHGEFSPGLTNLEYAPLAERMGRVNWCSEVFNCNAPDTGNMEVLAHYGTPEQQDTWLRPMLNGEMRSAYCMTEPDVASSDATNIATSIVRDGDDYVINGRKWWITNIMDPRCELLLVMGKTDPFASRHRQQSTIIVPRHTKGVSIIRSLPVFHNHNSPSGDAEVLFDNVRVPKENLIMGEGCGFEIAQGRLGPGRIHHSMRSIGGAQRCLELMAKRVENRVAFGKKLSEQGSIRQDIARSYIEVEQARLLTLKTADYMDKYGNKEAKDLIAAITIVGPGMLQTVADRALQAHGSMGLSQDTPIGNLFTIGRYLRLADGPDEVHLSQLGKLKIREYND